METQKQKKINESWDDYVSGNFLKAVNVQSENDAFVCTAIEEVTQEQVTKPRLTLERNGNEWEFDLNKTNSQKCATLGIASPSALVGKKIYFKKALVRNPKTNQEVDSLRISKIE